MIAAQFSRAETIHLGRQSRPQLRSLLRKPAAGAGNRRGRGRTRRQNPSGDFTGNYAASPWTGADGLLLFNANVGARRTPRRPPPAPIARSPDRHPICAKLWMIEWRERSKTSPRIQWSRVSLFPAAFSFFSLPSFFLLFRPKYRPRGGSSLTGLIARNIRVQIVLFFRFHNLCVIAEVYRGKWLRRSLISRDIRSCRSNLFFETIFVQRYVENRRSYTFCFFFFVE